MRFAQAFQPSRRNALSQPQKPCLRVVRKAGDLGGNSFVEDFLLAKAQPFISQF
jgi:hypothetical protein